MSPVETTLAMFACYCGCRSEEPDGTEPPACWGCGKLMHQWSTRVASRVSSHLSGERADTRTDNGGY